MEPSPPPFSSAASEPPLLQEDEQPQPRHPSAAASLRPIPSEGRRLVEPLLTSMDTVEEEKMNVEQQVAPVDEHQTTSEGCVQLPQKSQKRSRKEDKAKNLEEKRRKKQQEKRRKLEDKKRHNKEKEKKLQQKKNKDGTSPSAMHCNKEVRSPICRSPGVNMMRTLKRRSSEALRKRSNKSPNSHILDETPESRANSLSPRSAAYQNDVPTTTLAAKPRKLRSKAWVDFDPIYERGCIVSAKCKFCDQVLPATHKFGRNGLVRHASTCSSRSQIHLMVDKLKTSVSSPDASLVKQWDFDQGVSRRLLAEMIVLNDLPFSFVEYSGFRKFGKSLNPAFHMVHRTTISSDCSRLYHEHRSVLREFFKQYKGRVSLTDDLWTSNQKIGYICITRHYVHECKLQKRIIRFCRLETPHDGWSLYNVVLKTIQDWSIDDKLFGITLDNASNNGAMVRYLKENELVKQMLPCSGDLLHFRCAAHILNLIVQDGLDAMVGIIDNIRESVLFINNNPSRKERFDEICGRYGISGVARPSHDVPNRWNSSLLMLQSSVPFIKAFLALAKEDSSYIYCPSPEEWRKAAAVGNLLKGFYEATNILSGSSYPTSHLFFTQMWNIKCLLQKEASNPYDFVREMVDEMIKKFAKYWDECLISLCIPVIFDPRFKLGYIVFRMEKWLGAVRAEKVIVVVEDTVIRLFNDYSAKMGCMLSGTTQEEDGNADVEMEDDPMADWDQHLSAQQQEANNELDRYLKEDKFPRNVPFDILQWWDMHSAKYPILSCIARDVLAVQASTVSSESAFSTGGRVISDYRSRLAPDTVEEIICLQNWLKSERFRWSMTEILLQD